MHRPHKHKKEDIKIFEAFIQKFAERYIAQRSQTLSDYGSINDKMLYENLGFGTETLRQIISQNAIPIDRKREQGSQSSVFRDIYRSDLGELLMTYYFEEKLPEEERFIIPLKNITFRERAELPGRGLDAIGYKYSKGTVEILLGEAKVSAEKKSPPAVVDSNDDSLYKTHLKYKTSTPLVIQRLSDYARRLNAKDATIIGFAILCLNKNITDKCSITYGCTLIRDYTCVNVPSDYGKFKTNETEFEPGQIQFYILSFSNKSIDETVDMFYQKVQELITE
jgi:hypothetical protein